MNVSSLGNVIKQVAIGQQRLVGGKSSRRFDLQSMVAMCSDLCADLRSVSDDQLRCQCESMRRKWNGSNESVSDCIAMATSHVAESVRRCFAIELFETQLTAGIAMCLGNVAEMATGEGKTFAGLIPTYYFSLIVRGVHVCLPNSYLAARDFQLLSQPLRLLGVESALRGQDDTLTQTQNAYWADVTYGPGHVFGFDYLRDQWSRRQAAKAPVGIRTLNQLSGQGLEKVVRQRGLFAAVIDEVDQVLVDDATSPMIITDSAKSTAADQPVHLAACQFATTLIRQNHFRIESSAVVNLTEKGFRKVYEYNLHSNDQLLRRPWHDYVLAALKAKHVLLRDKDYVVQEDTVRLVEQSTGRVYPDRNWSGGLQQAVQAKEGLPITAESDPQGTITRQTFFRRYSRLCGMTGTAESCRSELRSVYGLCVHPIPTAKPCRRRVFPLGVYSSGEEKLVGLINEVQEMVGMQRCVLIGTNHIDQSRKISNALQEHSIAHQVLNGVQTESEANIIAQAGRPRCVTVATHLAGRGTDIQLDPSVAARGGLHVIGWEPHPLRRVDRQLIGRCARQGEPGTARFYLSPDDQFVDRYAPFLKPAIDRYLDNRSSPKALERGIRSAQEQYESKQRKIRHQMMVNSNRQTKKQSAHSVNVSVPVARSTARQLQ